MTSAVDDADGTAPTGPTPLLVPGSAAPGNSFVLWDHKLVYVSITKVANTSLRWMIADLAGEDPERFYRAPGNHVSRLMTIHAHRSTWQHATTIGEVPDEQLSEISRDNGWFVFVLVRDPWSRLWSAWSSKMLVRHGEYLRRYGEQDWFPRVPQRSGDVLDDWFRFIDARPWESDPLLSADPHFMTQVAKVRPEQVNYSRIYDLSDMGVLLEDLRAHLETVGKAKELYLPRANETPVPLPAQALDNGVAEAIEDSFRADFEAFGARWTRAGVKVHDGDIGADALHAVAAHVESNQRIDDMYLRMRSYQEAAAALRGQLARARARISELEQPAGSGTPSSGPAPARRAARAVLARSPQPVRTAARRLRDAVTGRAKASQQHGPSSADA